jgi:hypothetical protein
MIDTDKLRREVSNFTSNSSPTSGNSSDSCTVGDIKKVIEKTAKLFNAFITELEKNNN